MTIEVCVRVTEARGLAAKDQNGKSDPFYIVGVAGKSNGFKDTSICVRSKTIFCELNPVWNKTQRADFNTKSEEKIVRIEIWDKDQSVTNEFMGYALVDITFKGKDTERYCLKLLPENVGDEVTGSVYVTVMWNYDIGVHPSITFNKEQRAARIFLSSTFIDMHDERETIMRKVMVEMDQFCYERQVALTYIDMRWGITDEMSKEYKTILSCLTEVNNSRPYFVGIIGQRYGWHQEKDGADPILTKTFELAASHREYEWINNFRDRSVTELEILHGFLLHPSLPSGHSFFYFRDPSYLDTLDADTRSKFEDTSVYAKAQLAALKERISDRAAQWGVTCVESYKSPTDIGALLINDLKKAIDRDFPILTSTLIEKRTSTAQKQRTEHENYAHQRCHVYVPSSQYFHTLDAAVKEEGSPTTGRFVLVTGESGSGKSSMMANWWKSRTHASTKTKHASQAHLANTPTFIHFIGASVLSNSFNSLLLRLYDEINEAKGPSEVKIERPKDEEIVKSLPKFLKAASARGGMVIIFDAINQLPSKYHDLHWLPQSLPPKIYFIISSTSEPKVLEAVKMRSGGVISIKAIGAGEGRWTHMAVQPLDNEERKQIIMKRLSKYGKTMAEEDIGKIVSHPCSKLPLYITTVLLELCTIGFYAQFKEQLANFLACADMAALFKRVLERWEDSFGVELARDLLPLLANSRSGLTEKTIQMATNAPPIQLLPMLAAMKQMLVVNQSMYNFGHVYLKEAVRNKYTPEIHYAASCKLADVFSKETFDENIASKLPWQLEKIMCNPLCKESPKYQQRLADILLDLRKFMIFYEHDSLKYDLIKYWDKLVELNSNKWKMGPLYVESARKAIKQEGLITKSNSNLPNNSLPSSSTSSSGIHPTHNPETNTVLASPSTLRKSSSISSVASTNPTPPSTLKPSMSSPKIQYQPTTRTPSPSPPTTTPAPIRTPSPSPPTTTPIRTPSPSPPTNAPTPAPTHSHTPTPTPPSTLTSSSPISGVRLRSASSINPTLNQPGYRKSLPVGAPTQSTQPTQPTHPTHSTLSAQSAHATLSAHSAHSHPTQPTPPSSKWGSDVSNNKVQVKSITLASSRTPPPSIQIPSPSPSPLKQSPTAAQAPTASYGRSHSHTITSVTHPNLSPSHAKSAANGTPKAFNLSPSSHSHPAPSFPSSVHTSTPTSPPPPTIPAPAPSPSPSSPTATSTPTTPTSHTPRGARPSPTSYLPSTLFALSSFLFTVGLIHEALEVGELSLAEYRQIQDKNGIARSLYLLGVILRDQGYLGNARTYLSQALEIRVELYGEIHPEVATSLEKLGWLSKSTGDLLEALKYFTRALAIQKKLFGSRHEEVASSLNGLGSILTELGNLVQAREYFDEALSVGAELFGIHHPNVAQSLHNLGVLCLKEQKWDEAFDLCERARKIRVEVLGHHHVDVAASLSILGTINLQKENLKEAEDCFQKAQKIQSELLGPENPEVAVTLANLGVLEKRRGDLTKARTYNEGALRIRTKLFGDNHPLVESSLNNLGSCCFSQKDFEKARECFDKVLAIQVQRFGGYNNPRVQQTLGIMEGIAKYQGKLEDAKKFSSLIQKPPQN